MRVVPSELLSARNCSVSGPVMTHSGPELLLAGASGSLLATEMIWLTGAGSQWSVAATEIVTGTSLWLAGLICAGLAVIESIWGGVASDTVRTTAQVVALPAASDTVSVIKLVPKPTTVPAAGTCDFTRAAAGVQLSDATNCASRSGTSAWHWSFANSVRLAGQTTVGGVVSTTVSVVTQVAWLPAASVTVMAIGVVPQVTNVPAAGACAFCRAAAGVHVSAALKVAR